MSGAECGRCGALLAPPDQRLEVDGSAHHRFTNRAGVAFALTCYDHAPGCATGGPAGDEDTWFAGHTWQRSFCRACGLHTGWLFRSKARVFHALIDSRIETAGQS